MNQYEAQCMILHTLRYNIDQMFFNPPRQINGVFPTAMISATLWRIEEAAYKMADKTNKKYSGFTQTEFVNRNLTADEAKEFTAWVKKENERIPDMLGQIMVNEYKVSCTWNDQNQCYIATLTGKEDCKFNPYKALSARSDDWFEALAMAAYKHLILFSGKAWEGDTTKNNWG